MKIKLIVAAVAVVASSAALFMSAAAQEGSGGVETRPPNATNQTPAFPGQTRAPELPANVAFDVVTVAGGLQNPWGLTFLPDGRMLVTEKPGRLRVVTADGTLSEPVAGLPAVDARGQGGLLDVVLEPEFATSRMIYWSYSEPREGGPNNTAVARGRFVDDPVAPRVETVEVIYHQAPSLASQQHYGSRLVFGRDGTLFVTQGERSVTEGRVQAQRMDGLLGKIVRMNRDGSIPKDNPFVGKEGVRPEIWSYGHRNVQAAALHPTTGELWAIEHGTRGGDEINIARKGKDYGWPTIAYGIEYRGGPITGGITEQGGMEQPLYYWDPVIAPSGMAFYTGPLFPAWRGSLFVGGHGSQQLVRLTLDGEKVVGEEWLLRDLQPQRERIRDVRQGPDGALYVVINSPQKPGGPPGRILKLVPAPATQAPAAAAATTPTATGGIPDLAGVWDGGGRARPVNGVNIPWTTGKNFPELNERGLAYMKIFDEAVAPKYDCFPSTSPAIQYDPYFLEVVQWPDRVLLRYEKDDQLRTVWLDGRKPGVADFSIQGLSVGRYEGDALLVETTHFTFDITGFDDYNGIPSSQQKRVLERYWRDGADLRVTVTVEDPMFLRKPTSYTTRWIAGPRGYKLAPFDCDPESARASIKFLPPKYK